MVKSDRFESDWVERSTEVRILYPPLRIGFYQEVKSARSSMDRTSDSGSESWGFESLRAHQKVRRKGEKFTPPNKAKKL